MPNDLRDDLVSNYDNVGLVKNEFIWKSKGKYTYAYARVWIPPENPSYWYTTM